MARDLVCGMEVNEGEVPHRTTFKGTNYFFCSEKCLSQFEKKPKRYIKKHEKAAMAHSGHGGKSSHGCCH